MKLITGFVFCLAALIFCTCTNPTGSSAGPEPAEKTWICFVNNNDFSISVYSDYSRLIKIADVEARSRCAPFEIEPNLNGASFFPTCHILIDGVSIPYQMDVIIDKIDKEKSKEQPNIITVRSLEELSPEEKAKPLSASAYIKIENTGSSSLTFQQGNSELKPEGAASTILSGGNTGTYIVTPGPVSGYSLRKNTTDTINFPGYLTEFAPARLYSFVFNGTVFELKVTKDLTIDQVISDKYAFQPPAAPGKPIVIAGMNQLTVKWTASGGASSYEVFIDTVSTPPYSPKLTVNTTSAVIENLENNVTYYVWIRAKNNNGPSGYSPYETGVPAIPTTTPPVPPRPDLKAGSGKLTVSWQIMELAAAYELWFATTDNPTAAVKYGADIAVDITETVLAGLANDTTYYVWLKAKNHAGASGFSPAASGTPSAFFAVPKAPAMPTVIRGSGTLSVGWPPAEGALVYEIWIGTHNNSASAEKYGADISDASVIITQLVNNTTYYVWIKAKNNIGTSGFSPAASGTPSIFAEAPAAPAVPAVTTGDKRIDVSWTAVEGAAAYEVWMASANNSASAVKQGADAAGLSAAITGLTNGTAYYVWVKAKNNAGTSGFSPAASGRPIGSMGAVSVTTGSSGELVLAWSAVPGADQYEVYRSIVNTIPASPINTVSTTTATIGGLTNGTNYYFWVKPKNANGEGGTSAAASGRPIGDMGAVTVTTGESGELVLNWAAVPGADEYEVYRSAVNTMPASPAQTVSTTTATIDNLINGTDYYFWVKPKNINGEGGISAAASGKPIGNMGAVTVTTGNSGELVLAWSAVPGADQYEVFHNAVNTIPASPIQTVSTTTATIGGLTNGTNYYFWIKPINANGKGGTSAAASGRPIGTPAAPVITPGFKKFTVTWAAVAGADKYELYYGTGMPTTLAVTTTETTATIAGLTIGTTYHVRLRAVNITGVSGYGPNASNTPEGYTPGLFTENEKIGVYNLSDALSWLKTNAETGNYTIALGADESIAPQELGFSGKIVGITLMGLGGERVVNLNSSDYGNLFTINAGVTLTLKRDITLGNTINVSDAVLLRTNANLIMNIGAKIYSGVRIFGGTFNMNGGEISGDSVPGIQIESGTFIMKGGEISGNDFCGIEIKGGTFTMDDGEIRENNGSGISIYDGVTFTMNGGEIRENYYGVSIYDGGTFSMNGGEIRENISGLSGSGIYMRGGTFTMEGGEIGGNYNGVEIDGGIFIINDGKIRGNQNGIIPGYFPGDYSPDITMNGGEISSNISRGIEIKGGTFTMNNGEISNHTSYHGGGVSILSGASFIMNGGEIKSNTSEEGGGVYIYDGIFTMNNGKISGNTSGSGGGVSIGNTGSFTMYGGEISGNTSDYWGGAVYVNSGGTFQKLLKDGQSGIIYGADEVGVDAAGVPLKNTSLNNSGVIKTFFSPYLRRNTTAGQTDEIDSTTGKGLSANGEPPFGN